ncbi:exported hypothetical protein [Rhizobium sp. EC-SD404]|nr:exported hypothetical protein [Rhizobium sp. EC-SD404]
MVKWQAISIKKKVYLCFFILMATSVAAFAYTYTALEYLKTVWSKKIPGPPRTRSAQNSAASALRSPISPMVFRPSGSQMLSKP